MESLSRPLHRRKLSNANAFSFSAKQHPYDDVFTGPTPKFGAPVCAPDYSEIFGASRGSSIPVLDLSGKVSDDCRSSSKLDYPNIFGGFSEEDIAVPYEELCSGAKRGKRSSGKTRAVSEGSDQLSPSGRHKESSCEATNQSFETPKHFNLSYHKTSQRSKDGSNGMTQIAQLHAIPGFTYFIDESSHLPKTESRQQAPFMKTEVHRHKSFSGEIFKGGLDRKGDYLHVPKTQNRSFSGEIFQEGHTVNGNFHAPRKQSSHGHRNRRFSGEIFEEGHSGKRDLHVPKIQSSDKTVHNDRSFSGDLFNGRDRKEETLHVPEKQSSDGVAVKVSSGSSWDAFRFNDKFYCAHDEFDRRSSTTEEASTSKITSPDFKVGASERRGVHATNTSPPSSDEELDANSAAAISAATLKKAIEKAQESIRLAKELMERKRDGVPAPQKQRSKGGSIKSKEHKVECNNGDAVELHRKVGIGLPPFAEVGRRTPSSDGEFASSFKPKEHRWVAEKVKLNFQTENSEASQDDLAATWFSEVVSRRKKDIETLASQQVESDTSNLELGEESNKKLTMNVLEEAEAPEQYMDTSDPAQVHGSEEYVKSEITNEYCFAKEKQNYSSENSENMKKNVEASVDEQWGFKNLQNSQEPLNEEKAGFEEFENDVLRMNRDTPSENETEKCADLEEELEVVYEVEEKKSRLRSDEEEPEIVGKETPLWMENEEKPQHEDFQGVQDTGEWSNVVQEREMSESKMTCSREEERNEIKQVGSDMVGLEKISVVPEAPEKIENRADRKKEASQDAEETNRRMEASDTSEDEPETIVARDAGDKQNSDFGEMQGVSKAISGLEECEKDDVTEESPNCKEKEIPGASSDLQNASEEDTSEGKGQDIYKEVSSEDAEEVVSTCMNSGENLPSERVISEEPENTTFTVGDNESHFMPDIHHSEEPESATFTNIKVEELFEEETGRDPDASSNLDERDDFWVHGHVENEENFEGVIMATDHIEKDEDIETAQQEKKSVENSDELECSSLPGEEIKAEMHEEESSKLSQQTVVEEEIKESLQHKNNFRKNEVDERQREREKDRLAVERAIREARERAFAEARERAERAAVERATAEVRQRVVAEAREKREKASASNKASTTDKASIEAKLKAERAAVERATSEARERALEKALSQKSTAELTSQGDKHGLKHSFSSSDLEKFDGSNSESAQRRKARLERHQRIMERAAQALAEKNRRDLLAQKEQTERNRLAEALDADIKRWASGKEGNLRALLSTLQYILGPESGWQPISLTEIITTAAVKKAYRRATLYVHPDKLQQRGASIQQKYVCEKVFDLLKAAWNRFNSEER